MKPIVTWQQIEQGDYICITVPEAVKEVMSTVYGVTHPMYLPVCDHKIVKGFLRPSGLYDIDENPDTVEVSPDWDVWDQRIGDDIY